MCSSDLNRAPRVSRSGDRGKPAVRADLRGGERDAAAAAREAARSEYGAKRYHQAADEWSPDWDYSGFVVLGQFALDIAREAADANKLPTWNAGDEFLPAREKSGVK